VSARLGVVVAVTFLACSGKSVVRESSDGGAGSDDVTPGGAPNEGGVAGRNRGGSSTGGASTGGSSTGGASTGGSNTGGSGARPPATGPAPNWSSTLPSADPLNSTPPVLVALDDDIIIAGGTSDPTLAGLDSFEPGTAAESFVARLDHEGNVLWTTPIVDSGLPSGVAIDPSGDIIVIGPFWPDGPGAPGSGSDSTYWARLSPTGELVEQREIDFYSTPVCLAVDGNGHSYLGGWEPDPDTALVSYLVFARYDERGDEVWKRRFRHDETSTQVMSLSIAPSGDLVLSGFFNGSMDLGGGPLATERPGWITNGFLARFNADGEHLSSARFGGSELDVGWFVHALPEGDVLLGGTLTGNVDLLGEMLVADSDAGSGFLARVDAENHAQWAAFPAPGIATAIALDPDGELIHIAGHGNATSWLASYTADGAEALFMSLPGGEYFYTRALAVDSRKSLWVSGGFHDQADFGDGYVLESDGAGTFLVRFDGE
jgi:hypothetical protein